VDLKEIQKAFLGKFRQSVDGHIGRLTDFFTKIEKGEGGNLGGALISELHNLKGEVRLMGFLETGKMLQGMEDVLKKYREKSFAGLSGFAETFQEGLRAVQECAAGAETLDLETLHSKIAAHREKPS
jgi:chemotaxis protein histidine kinase CheA